MALFSLPVSLGPRSVSIDVYEAVPSGPSRGTVIIVQEIFGLTEHIRSVADRYAALGFRAWAPAFYDLAAKNTLFSHDQDSLQKGLQLMTQIGWEGPLEILRACDRKAGEKMAVIGFCWGGSLAWLASTRLEPGRALKACVGYYGSKAPEFKNEKPRIPVMLHFGEEDRGIPMEKVRALMEAQPQVPVELYKAGHAFNRDGCPSYNAEAAKLAQEKTIAFLIRNGF